MHVVNILNKEINRRMVRNGKKMKKKGLKTGSI